AAGDVAAVVGTGGVDHEALLARNGQRTGHTRGTTILPAVGVVIEGRGLVVVGHENDDRGLGGGVVALDGVHPSAVPTVGIPTTCMSRVRVRGALRTVVRLVLAPERVVARDHRGRRARNLTETRSDVAGRHVVARTRLDAEHHVHP